MDGLVINRHTPSRAVYPGRKGGTIMSFKNKQELIDFIKQQTNVSLPNPVNSLNSKRKILYTEIKRSDAYKVLPLLVRKGVRYEAHVENAYWIYVR